MLRFTDVLGCVACCVSTAGVVAARGAARVAAAALVVSSVLGVCAMVIPGLSARLGLSLGTTVVSVPVSLGTVGAVVGVSVCDWCLGPS